MARIIKIDDGNFSREVGHSGKAPIAVFFTDSSKRISPTFSALAGKFPESDARFAQYDEGENGKLARDCSAVNLPMIVFFGSRGEKRAAISGNNVHNRGRIEDGISAMRK